MKNDTVHTYITGRNAVNRVCVDEILRSLGCVLKTIAQCNFKECRSK